MRLLLQRVKRGSVSVDSRLVAEIGKGLVILIGVGHYDSEKEAKFLAEKAAALRIFEDAEGKMNFSLQDVGGEALVVSQFTLYADTRKGRRPAFTDAAAPQLAEPLVEIFAQHLRSLGIPTQMGVFGAEMLVEILNDGPVTIYMERSPQDQ